MINPISILMTLGSRRADIQRAVQIYEQNKKSNTELIDIARSVATDLGVLDAPAGAQTVSGLERYDTAWIQRSLNTLMGASLLVDGKQGEATDAAVLTFQKAQNKKYPDRTPLQEDGRSGVITAGRVAEELSKIP